MTTSIFDYPPVERKYVAVRRYQNIYGEKIFDRLLKRLDLSRDEFVDEWGDRLVGDPAPGELNDIIVDIEFTNRVIGNVGIIWSTKPTCDD